MYDTMYGRTVIRYGKPVIEKGKSLRTSTLRVVGKTEDFLLASACIILITYVTITIQKIVRSKILLTQNPCGHKVVAPRFLKNISIYTLYSCAKFSLLGLVPRCYQGADDCH